MVLEAKYVSNMHYSRHLIITNCSLIMFTAPVGVPSKLTYKAIGSSENRYDPQYDVFLAYGTRAIEGYKD